MKKPDRHVPTYDGRRFEWIRGVGVVERSDLQHDFGGVRIWNDACDVGFYVKSHKTGNVKLFTFSREIMAQDEIVGGVFRNEDGVEIHILND